MRNISSKDLETIIRISADLDTSVKKALAGVESHLDEMEASARKAQGSLGELAGKLADQGAVLEAAKKKYASYVLSGEKGSKQAKALAKEIKGLSADMKKNKSAIEKAEAAADKLAPSLEDVGKEAEDTKGGFTVMKGAMADLVSKGISSLISFAKDAVTGLANLAESTQEYREDMGKLETAWESAGRSTKLATETYKNFYSVLGEEDRSVEAVNHLAKFVETEQDMQKWTNIATGVWGTFGDSLPIEGLTEASNETAKVGKVTGVLADALNWAGVNEDAFQKSLDACNNEQERSELITETLNELYSTAADNYRENNESIIASRKATSDYTDTVAAFGEKVEPITTRVREGFNKVLEKVLELVEDVDLDALGEKIDGAFDGLINNVLPKVVDAIDWIGNNTGLIKGIAIAIGVVAGAIGLLNVVMTIQNAIWFASPITWIVLGIVAAIAAVIAIIVVCVKHWDDIKAAAQSAVEWIVSAWGTATTWLNENVFQPIGNFFTNLRENAKNVVDGIKEFFVNGFKSLIEIVKKPINAVIGIINGAIDEINAIGFDIPDWVPVIGGQKFALNIPKLEMLASGGFTNGVSIAGEAGTEAVISFDPAYRAQNLSYWAQAGRMLGAEASDFSLSGGSDGGVYYDLGGVSFAPNIVINGETDKQSIMEAIEAEYPEFIDMIEQYLAGRGRTVYA